MKARTLRHYFFRVFFSLLLMVGLVLFIQALVIGYGAWNADRYWPVFVVNDYVSRLMTSFSELEDPTIEEVMDTFSQCMDERVSGLFVRSAVDGNLFLFGRVPAEEQGKPPAQKRLRKIDETQEMHTFTKESQVFVMDITLAEGSFSATVTPVGNGNDGFGSVTYTLPGFIRPDDVAATIFLTIDGQLRSVFDVLVINIATFESTRYMLDALIMALAWMLPACLVISVLVSVFMSRRNSRAIGAIRNALEEISHGGENVTIARQRTYELDEIARSIRELDINLQKNKFARKEWIRSIAHDLNTPLTSINLLVEGLADGIWQADDNFIATLRREVGSMTSRISAVRYFATLMDPDFTVQRQELDLGQLVSAAVGQIASARISLTVLSSSEVSVDQALTARALSEVFKNALEADDGQVSVVVDGTVVRVRNKGRLPEDHPDLFEPWARGDRSRHEGGNGLGLPIVGQICSLLGAGVDIRQDRDDVVVTLDFSGCAS